jgi:hypothetical protein
MIEYPRPCFICGKPFLPRHYRTVCRACGDHHKFTRLGTYFRRVTVSTGEEFPGLAILPATDGKEVNK